MTLPPSVNKVARVCLQEGEGQLSHPLMNTPSPEFCFHKEMSENVSVWTLIKTLPHCHYIIFFRIYNCLCIGISTRLVVVSCKVQVSTEPPPQVNPFV